MEDKVDRPLLERAQTGDSEALDQLLERHQAQVYRFGMKMCRDPEDAKDVLQDTLLAMARGVRTFRGASSISTWLYTIARSFCIKKQRKTRFALDEERSLEEANQLADPALGPDEALAGKRVERALERAIGSLEPIYREVLLLRDIEGLSASEVAEVLGVSVPAVKSRLHRARLSVRAQVAPLLGLPVEGAATAAATASGQCPDVLTLFSQHLEDEISADICAELESHLQRCDRCRNACDSLKRTLALCKTAPAPRVPESVQKSVRVAIRDFLADQA